MENTKSSKLSRANVSLSSSLATNGFVKLKTTPAIADAFQWYKDGNLIAGATTTVYITSSAGIFTATVTKLGCTGTSNAITIAPSTQRQEGTTITEGSFELSAYPNPVSDVLTVTLSGIEDVNGTLKMIDVLGKAVQCHIAMVNNSTFNIQTSTLSSGVYFIRYKDSEGRTGTLKVVKE